MFEVVLKIFIALFNEAKHVLLIVSHQFISNPPNSESSQVSLLKLKTHIMHRTESAQLSTM